MTRSMPEDSGSSFESKLRFELHVLLKSKKICTASDQYSKINVSGGSQGPLTPGIGLKLRRGKIIKIEMRFNLTHPVAKEFSFCTTNSMIF